ncbi:hypothetical protein BVY01_03490 [bacterium I07]|nr:hypothetical protein BVY01_03490 [bacterium I07]
MAEFKNNLTLDTSVQYCKGIGPRRADLLRSVGIQNIEDLITYYPRRHLDRSHLTSIQGLRAGEHVTVVGSIISAEIRKGRRSRYVVWVADGTGMLQCVWFQGVQYISKVFQTGDLVAFSGKVSLFRGPQLVHPEYDKISDEGETNPLHTVGIIPLYSSTEQLGRIGLDSRGFRRIIREALDRMQGGIPETLSNDIIERQSLQDRASALENIHFPIDWNHFSESQKRLKFEELFYIQLHLALQRRSRQMDQRGIAFKKSGSLARGLIERLPFELTEAQKNVIREIREDMRVDRPMNRLLQGDVGSGKTIVALLGMLIAVENGYQAALMVPTEILAEQHYLTVNGWLTDEVKVGLLKGGQKGSERKKVVEKLETGQIDIIIGTHALIQGGIQFKNLGFVVIDEQHRFGVMQRATLRDKALYPDVLVMTATPIPRTLALTFYGDLDVSVLNERPPGRLKIRTVWRRDEKRSAIYQFISETVAAGQQVYIVYPLVEESEKIDLAAATQGFDDLSQNVFPDLKIALLHGRMKSDEKESVMRAFKAGDVQILVTTTVIEVGVDVPQATVMLLEHAERFGLTQMHQLRGRIGRGTQQSTCILLTQGHLSEEALNRLQAMTDSDDGFHIAEVDLKLRGPGEIFGKRQHGDLNLKIADLATDGQILNQARKEAFSLIEDDAGLNDPGHQPIERTYRQQAGTFRLMEVG